MKQLSILVTTVDDGLEKNPDFFKNIDFELCEVIVIQQLINSEKKLILNNEAKVYSYKEKGVSIARNRALELAKSDIVLIADDDTYFLAGFEHIILNAFKQHKDAHIITFQALNTLGNSFKKYPTLPYKHTFRSIFKISAIEICINISKFNDRKLFDENYGPGSVCNCGSDTVFVVDSYHCGLNMYYIPTPIVVHPPLSSGRTYSKEKTYHKGIMYRRSFGLLSFFLAFAFSVLKYREYKKDLGFFSFLFQFWKGCMVKL